MTFEDIIANLPKPYYRDEQSDIVIYCADCRDILPLIPDKSIDLVLTDFPYGNDTDYGGYEDSRENLYKLIVAIMPHLIRVSPVALIACGIGNMFMYPHPDWVLSWHWEHTHSGSSKWGFNNWQPILAYGKDPYLSNGLGRRQDSIRDKSLIREYSKVNHPCPKPQQVWSWLLVRGSINSDNIILDPFLGSGTTAYCAKKLNRKCIGIEIEEKYCEIAKKRLSQSVMRLEA